MFFSGLISISTNWKTPSYYGKLKCQGWASCSGARHLSLSMLSCRNVGRRAQEGRRPLSCLPPVKWVMSPSMRGPHREGGHRDPASWEESGWGPCTVPPWRTSTPFFIKSIPKTSKMNCFFCFSFSMKVSESYKRIKWTCVLLSC